MSLTTIGPFVGVPADPEKNYHGDMLLYVSWDHHLMFAAPFIMCVSPQMVLRDLLKGPVSELISPDPDAGKVEWKDVQWLKGGKPFTADLGATLKDNGIRHKDQLRMVTPHLTTLVPK